MKEVFVRLVLLAAAAMLVTNGMIRRVDGAAGQAGGNSGAAASPAAAAGQDAAPVANPISSTVKTQLARFSKNMVAAADSMPAEKYSFKPTPEMNTFAHLVMHIAQSNNGLCAKISGMDAPDVKLTDADGKQKLVAALKASFEFCDKAPASVDDSKLGTPMTLFGNRPSSRGTALVVLSDDWYDHYGAEAVYLRLNGILPPTAQPQPAKQ